MKDPRVAVARFYIVERWGGYAGETYGVGPELVIQAKPAA